MKSGQSSTKQLHIRKGTPYPLGATLFSDGINFSVAEKGACIKGVVLIEIDTGKRTRIDFAPEHRIGNIAAIFVEGIDTEHYGYRFYNEQAEYMDAYAKKVYGNEQWGKGTASDSLYAGFHTSLFSWNKDEPLRIPYEDSIIYCLHVRGFTKHKSSGIQSPGTFRGITEKVQYLKKLGITAIELLPAYEFEEKRICNESGKQPMQMSQAYAIEHYKDRPDIQEPKTNYWGFTSGYYFAPKASYASNPQHADTEFKQMVQSLHRNGIEVIMQLYFPDQYKPGFILDVVKYWVTEYHIDGVHVKGNRIPIILLSTEPLLSNTKILHDNIPVQEIYEEVEKPAYRNLCIYADDFMYQMRRFLKGDEDMLQTAVSLMKRNPEKCATVNFITNYYGFTLADLVSYDKKHNEENGEMNRDGADYNYSWNCGIEGDTRKSSILSLRQKQMKNALLLVLLSQGTPLIMSGDEFGNSQKGNNNPYCQDNETTWLNWNMRKSGKELLDFTRSMIAFRKSQPFLGKKEPLVVSDVTTNRYPEISYHAKEAWRADFGNYNRHIAVMLTQNDTQNKISAMYVAYNMHWQTHRFALPKLPKGQHWITVAGTETGKIPQSLEELGIRVEERSIKILVATV